MTLNARHSLEDSKIKTMIIKLNFESEEFNMKTWKLQLVNLSEKN